MIWVSMNLLPTVVGAILICGVLAAGLSSASTFLSLVGFSVSHDILGSAEAVVSEDELSQLAPGRATAASASGDAVCRCYRDHFGADVTPQHLLVNALCRAAVRVVVGGGRVYEHMEPPHHRIRRFLGYGDGLRGECRHECAVFDWTCKIASHGRSDSRRRCLQLHRCGACLSPRHRNRDGIELSGRPASHAKCRARSCDGQTNASWPKVMVTMGALIAALMTLFYALSTSCGKCSAQPRGAFAMSGELVLAMSYGLVLVGAGLWTWRRVLKDYRDDDH